MRITGGRLIELRMRGAVVLARVAWVLRRVIGAPDYEAYVAHLRAMHPGAAPVTPDDFRRDRLAARYSRPGSRCC